MREPCGLLSPPTHPAHPTHPILREITATVPARSAEHRYQRFRLVVTHGPDRGAEQECEGPELSVGTAPRSGLVLTDRTLSRHHCSITATARGFRLQDLGSRGGCSIAGCAVETAHLRHGAQITIGESVLRFERLDEEGAEPASDSDRFGRVWGGSLAMRRAFMALSDAASSTEPVLLEGEAGSGKRRLAEAVHLESSRIAGSFVAVDCRTVSERSLPPLLERAGGGTLLLDRVAELDLDLQPRLLRPSGARIIATTERDLRVDVNRGRFRADAYDRIGVRVRVPALRERRDDVPALVTELYREIVGADCGAAPPSLVASLSRRDWPGNVRELRAAVELALISDDGDGWDEAEPATRAWFDATVPFRDAREHMLLTWERAYLHDLVRRVGMDLSAAARTARVDRSLLRALLRRHGLWDVG